MEKTKILEATKTPNVEHVDATGATEKGEVKPGLAPPKFGPPVVGYAHEYPKLEFDYEPPSLRFYLRKSKWFY